jgi:hypothetical protein
VVKKVDSAWKKRKTIHKLQFTNNHPSRLIDSSKIWLIDLFGDCLPDIVSFSPLGSIYWKNLEGCNFGGPYLLKNCPSGISLNQKVSLVDMTGDGLLDLLIQGNLFGFFKATREGGWKDFYPFDRNIGFKLSEKNLHFADLSGNGRFDALEIYSNYFLYYPNISYKGFGEPYVKEWYDPPTHLYEHAFRMADMNGDGLQDIIQFTLGETGYWPNLKYGKFGRHVTMRNTPWFATSENFDPRKVFFIDINGDNFGDMVVVRESDIKIFLNILGEEWNDGIELKGFYPGTDIDYIMPVDLLGNRSTGLLFTTLGGDYFFIEFLCS